MPTHYIDNKKLEKSISSYSELKRSKLIYEMLMRELNCLIARKQSRQCNHDEETNKLENYKIEHKIISSSYEELGNILTKEFYKLSENLNRFAKFSYIEPEDAIQEGILICFERIDMFDPKKGKAFSFMTACIYNQLKQNYRVAKGYNELKKKRLLYLMHGGLV